MPGEYDNRHANRRRLAPDVLTIAPDDPLSVAVVDLDVDDRVLGIEVLDQSKFDLDVVAAEFGIAELVPQIRAAIAVAKPGP